jgi:hypothetical protein
MDMVTPITYQDIAAVCRLFGWPVPTPDMPGAVTGPPAPTAWPDVPGRAQGPPAQTLDYMLGQALDLFRILALEQARLRDGAEEWRALDAQEVDDVMGALRDHFRYYLRFDTLDYGLPF